MDDARLWVDAERGVLHESAHRVWLDSPVSAASARWIVVPPFLVELLHRYLAGHDAPMVFPNAAGTWQRRSHFTRRVMRPAADGTDDALSGRQVRLRAVKPGLRFHGLRLSHRMWLVEDGVPEVMQAVRLGLALAGRIEPLSSHAPAVERWMVGRLQARFMIATESEIPCVRAFLATTTGDQVKKLRSAA